jgi:hypothetical protein
VPPSKNKKNKNNKDDYDVMEEGHSGDNKATEFYH